MSVKLDILVIVAHPDDAELGCAGTLLKHIALGDKVGVVDLTRGELGTRGSAELRAQESDAASKMMGLSARENLGLPDGLFENSPENQKKVAAVIRKYQPNLVITNAKSDRHPDHGRAAALVTEAAFISGLAKLDLDGDAWRPSQVYYMIQDRYHQPDVVVDISEYYEQRMETIMCYKSQFYNPESDEPETAISSGAYLEGLKGRALEFGRVIGASYGEGFQVARTAGVDTLNDLK